MIIIMPRIQGEDRVHIDPQVIKTLDARMGTSGGNVPIVFIEERDKECADEKDAE